jgi:hypothetical protein
LLAAERNYGVVVDAGSSSSKVHLFQWPLHDGNPAKLLTIKPVVDELGDPRIKKVEPGNTVTQSQLGSLHVGWAMQIGSLFTHLLNPGLKVRFPDWRAGVNVKGKSNLEKEM